MKRKIIVTSIIALVLVMGIAYANKHATSTYTKDGTSLIDTEEARKEAEIRQRADIQKQQELIVKETYLLEKKGETEKAKEAAIVKYDADLANIESQLESVRGQKVSFQ